MVFETVIGPIAAIIDKVIPDKQAREKAKLELLALQGTQELRQIEARLSAIVAEARSADGWTSRARPSFLYVMYTLILFSLPMGIIAAFDPTTARAIAKGMATSPPCRNPYTRSSVRGTSATLLLASGEKRRVPTLEVLPIAAKPAA